jgi:hypothetical protein
VQQYRWNWWFPEDYKVWFPQHWGAFFSGSGNVSDLLGTSQDWHNIWNWLVYRTPFGDRGARLLYVMVRRDLVPGARYFRAPVGTTAPPPAQPSTRSLPFALSWQASGGKVPLDGPRGVAADAHGNLYVADTLNHRIAVYDARGRFLRAWGSVGTGPGQFAANQSPGDVAVASNGNVYVADTWNQRIEEFTSMGRFLRQWGGGATGAGPGPFYGPRSLAVAPSGRVYVADTGNKRILVYSPDGHYVTSFGSPGSGPGEFNEPSSVTVDGRGHLFVADFWNRRIQELTPAGGFLRAWSVSDWVAQTYDEPYVAVDRETGNLLATDPQQHQVLVYTHTGQLVGQLGSSDLSMPIGVASSAGGHVAVTDQQANRLDLFSARTPASGKRARTGSGVAGKGSKGRSR